MSLRSDRWVQGDTEVALDSRVALRMGGAAVTRDGGRPIIGIANSASELNPCNMPLAGLIEPLRAGILQAGGIPVVFPVMSLGEDLIKPSSMLYRNLLSIELEESVRSQPLDAVVVLAGCDKTVPGALMGAFSTNLPVLLLVAGPRPVASFEGRRIGTGTDLWRMWDERRAGRLSDDRWAALESALAKGLGTCNTMGTASSMSVVTEALGLAWPGSTTVPAGDRRHHQTAAKVGVRIVELVHRRASALTQVTPEAFENALTVLAAVGGSTNAVVHLTALAGRLGYSLTLDDVDRVGRATPVIVDVEPSGAGLIEELDRDGGVPAVLRALGQRLHLDAVLADGRRVADVAAAAPEPTGVIRSPDDALDPDGAFRVVRGNLAPDGALIKRSAATPGLLAHKGPAYVINGYDELEARTGPESDCPADAVLVFSGGGPVGGPGMPEWGMVPIPAPLLERGVRDMVRVTDARMSGTSFGTVFLHAAPEGAIGGPIGLVRDGDLIAVDAEAGTVHLDVTATELAARAAANKTTTTPASGYVALYRRHVTQAPSGCDFRFLVPGQGEAPRLIEPTVGRS